jgi:hypothetical protein
MFTQIVPLTEELINAVIIDLDTLRQDYPITISFAIRGLEELKALREKVEDAC